MSESRVGRWLSISLIAAVTATSAFVVAVAPQPTAASWTSAKAFATTATAVTPAAVPTVSCGAPSGLLAQAIPISWTAPAGPTPSRYRVHWQGTAGTGDATFTTSPGQIGGNLISVLGTSNVTVYAEYGDWTAPVSLQSRTVTTIAVVVVVSWTCG